MIRKKLFIISLCTFGVLCIVGFALMQSLSRQISLGSIRDCKNNLRAISDAMIQYQKINGKLPPQYYVDNVSGHKHSWRIMLLPFLGRKDIYERYVFSESWDSPSNMEVAKLGHYLFHCPSADDDLHTSYVMVCTTDMETSSCLTEKDPDNFLDDSRIIILEICNSGIYWHQPKDILPVEAKDLFEKGSIMNCVHHPDTTYAILRNGEVILLRATEATARFF